MSERKKERNRYRSKETKKGRAGRKVIRNADNDEENEMGTFFTSAKEGQCQAEKAEQILETTERRKGRRAVRSSEEGSGKHAE